QHDARPTVLTERSQDRLERSLRGQVLSGRSRRDERLEVAQQQLRVDWIAVEPPAERGDEATNARTVDAHAERDRRAWSGRARTRDGVLRIGDRAQPGRRRLEPMGTHREDERLAERSPYDQVGGPRREPAHVDAADRDAVGEHL